MISDITKEQLDELSKSFDFEWINNTTCNIIKKEVKDPNELIPKKEYDIEVFDYIVNEPPNFTLSTNWNGGTKIKSTNLHIYLKEIRGKMLVVDARDDLGNNYQAIWLPRASIKNIK